MLVPEASRLEAGAMNLFLQDELVWSRRIAYGGGMVIEKRWGKAGAFKDKGRRNTQKLKNENLETLNHLKPETLKNGNMETWNHAKMETWKTGNTEKWITGNREKAWEAKPLE